MERDSLMDTAQANPAGPAGTSPSNRTANNVAVPGTGSGESRLSLSEGSKGYFSEQSRTSNWLRTVVSATPIASVVSDPRLPDNPIIALNQAFVELTGYEPHEVLDRNCRFLSGSRTEP